MLSTYKLKATVVTKHGLLANADWMYQRVMMARLLIDDDHARPTQSQVQAMTDVLASFGWNAGKRRPTKSLSPTAWWMVSEQDKDDENTILGRLHYQYNLPHAKHKLLESIRRHHTNYLPCRLHPTDPLHRYHVIPKTPFRLRCRTCRHNLNSGESMKLFARLIVTGQVPRVAADLDGAMEMDDHVTEHSRLTLTPRGTHHPACPGQPWK